MNVVGGPPCPEPTTHAKGDSIPKSAPLCWWRLHSPTQSVETPTNPAPRHRRTSAPSLLRSWQESIRMGGVMGDSQEPASALVPPLILKAVIPPSGTAPKVIVPLHACNVPTAGRPVPKAHGTEGQAPPISKPLRFPHLGTNARRRSCPFHTVGQQAAP